MRTRVRIMKLELKERERELIAKHLKRFGLSGLHQWGFVHGAGVDDKRTTDGWGIGE